MTFAYCDKFYFLQRTSIYHDDKRKTKYFKIVVLQLTIFNIINILYTYNI